MRKQDRLPRTVQHAGDGACEIPFRPVVVAVAAHHQQVDIAPANMAQ
jgi:hypothetical protein